MALAASYTRKCRHELGCLQEAARKEPAHKRNKRRGRSIEIGRVVVKSTCNQSSLADQRKPVGVAPTGFDTGVGIGRRYFVDYLRVAGGIDVSYQVVGRDSGHCLADPVAIAVIHDKNVAALHEMVFKVVDVADSPVLTVFPLLS